MSLRIAFVIHLSRKQECIPVGCVPSATVHHGPGGCTWSVVTWSRGVLGQGMYLVPWGCSWSQGCVLGAGGVPGARGVPGLAGVPGPGGCVPGPRGCTWSGSVPGPRGAYLVWGVTAQVLPLWTDKHV